MIEVKYFLSKINSKFKTDSGDLNQKLINCLLKYITINQYIEVAQFAQYHP